MKGLGKRILVMAAVTAVCVWAAGKSGYAVKPYRLDEDTLAQQVQTLKENNLTKFSGVTIYDGIVIGDTAYYVMKQDFPEQEGMLGEMTAKRSWLGTWNSTAWVTAIPASTTISPAAADTIFCC